MTELANRALLPAGLRDILPPFAAHEADVVNRVMAVFSGHGYQRVKPPLIEFEDSLLSGVGADMAKHTFRVMDPISQRMMAVRSDMTLQVARIATTRLTRAPRPLRLSYSGQVLRVKGTQLRADRQFAQAGVELIGPSSAAADAEVILLAAEALAVAGVKDVTVDLTLPTLVPLVVAGLGDEAGLRDALDHKDASAVTALGGKAAKILSTLIQAVGPADKALAKLAALSLPPAAAAARDRLAEVVALVRRAAPDLTLTVDPVENRGFEYHTGIAFTVFARHASGELGRGGRYLADGEPATGATLFMDTVLEAVPGPLEAERVFVPLELPPAVGARLRAEGRVTVAGLEETKDAMAEAKRLACSHVAAADGAVVAVE